MRFVLAIGIGAVLMLACVPRAQPVQTVALSSCERPGSHGYPAVEQRETSSKSQLQGHVRSAVSGRSIGHAVVRLEGTKIETVVNQDGMFALHLPSAGQYVVLTRAIGYRPARDTVIVGPREDVHVEIALGDPVPVRCGF